MGKKQRKAAPQGFRRGGRPPRRPGGNSRATPLRDHPASIAWTIGILVLVTLMAAVWDYSLYRSMAGPPAHQAPPGLPFGDVAIGVGFTGLALYSGYYLWCELRRARRRTGPRGGPRTRDE